jgi:hypothetical protein
MTMAITLPQLAVLTVRNPKEAATYILGQNLPREALWMALVLVAILNTILSSLSDMLVPVPPPLDAIIANPFVFFVIVAGGLLLTVYAIYWAGRMMGGQGGIEDLLALIVWLQVLRSVAQAAVMVTLVVAPYLASFLVLIVGAATIWIFVNFVNAGLHFNSLIRALVVVIIGGIALMIGLTVFLSVIGVTAVGVPASV